ncbi:hypothetical protein O181_100910 [Austropuccinia psidii MF-1]|uniref:Tf2-1-like SH3-like domain-containing protein n=1 Tax=Austropuccinia psidii MF-1 TaxID=1389203 RepID=A0A9Q3JDI5_9BASI|nr:hypothetical protein [Austropuccinia psidii MF-1]
MDWVTGLPPGGDRIYNACLVVVDRFSSTPIFLPCQNDDTTLMIWKRVISWTGIFKDIISDRDPKFTSALWTSLHQLFGTKFSFSERMIQKLEDMVRIFCAYGLEFKYCDGITDDWCTLLPALEFAYKTSIHSSNNQTSSSLEKGWNPKLPQDSLTNNLVGIHPTADKWDKSHATPDFKVGDLLLVSTANFNKIKGCKKLKYSFAGPFVIKALHGENAIEVELSEELSNKHPTFPVSLVKPYNSSDAERFPLRNKVPLHIPPIESSVTKKITKFLKERNLRTKKVREYLVSYSDPAYKNEWLAEKDIPEAA